MTSPLSGNISIGRLGLAMINLCTKFKVSACCRYENMNGCAKWSEHVAPAAAICILVLN